MADAKKLLAGVRAKYPGSYDNTPDEVLLAGIKKKYPGAYDSYSLQPSDYLSQLGRDAQQFGYGFANEAALNVPDLLTNKVPALKGLNPGEPTDISERINRGAGSILGFGVGLPEHIGKKAITTIGKPAVKALSKSVGKRFAIGGLEAATGSLASAPFRALNEGKEYSPSGEAGRTAMAFGLGGVAGNVAARFTKGGQYIAAKNALRKAEEKLSKLTSELTQIGDKKLTTTLGKEIKPAKNFDELNSQIKQTTDEIFNNRRIMIKSRNRPIQPQEYIDPLKDWVNRMEQKPEFQGKLEPVKEYIQNRETYHSKNGMDLVGVEQMKEDLQKLTQSLLNSASPTESQAVMKQGMNELRSISKGVVEKYVPEVKVPNSKYEALLEGGEAVQKMGEGAQKSVKPTLTQRVLNFPNRVIPIVPRLAKEVDTNLLPREMQARLPRYTKEIASQAGKASKAQGQMNAIRPRTPIGPQKISGFLPEPPIIPAPAPKQLPAPDAPFVRPRGWDETALVPTGEGSTANIETPTMLSKDELFNRIASRIRRENIPANQEVRIEGPTQKLLPAPQGYGPEGSFVMEPQVRSNTTFSPEEAPTRLRSMGMEIPESYPVRENPKPLPEFRKNPPELMARLRQFKLRNKGK